MGFLSNFFGSSETKQNPATVWGPQAGFLQQLYGSGRSQTGAAADYTAAQLPGLEQAGMAGLGSLATLSQIGNPFVQGQIGVLGDELGRFYQQQILPNLRGSFADAGQAITPGGRYDPLAAQYGGDIARTFTQGATQLLGDSTRQAIAAASQIPQATAGLQGTGINAFLGPYLGLANILGTGPTVLGGGASSSGPGLGYSLLSSFAGGLGSGIGGNWS